MLDVSIRIGILNLLRSLKSERGLAYPLHHPRHRQRPLPGRPGRGHVRRPGRGGAAPRPGADSTRAPLYPAPPVGGAEPQAGLRLEPLKRAKLAEDLDSELVEIAPGHLVRRPVGHVGEGFVWGAATAAYQIEGAAARTAGAVDLGHVLPRARARSRDGNDGEVACDHYHR